MKKLMLFGLLITNISIIFCNTNDEPKSVPELTPKEQLEKFKKENPLTARIFELYLQNNSPIGFVFLKDIMMQFKNHSNNEYFAIQMDIEDDKTQMLEIEKQSLKGMILEKIRTDKERKAVILDNYTKCLKKYALSSDTYQCESYMKKDIFNEMAHQIKSDQ
jgi:hypothetical protein